jgi:hypothetical protein
MSLRGALFASLPLHDGSRGGNLELTDLFNNEIASLRSQRRLKDFFNSLINLPPPDFFDYHLADLRTL